MTVCYLPSPRFCSVIIFTHIICKKCDSLFLFLSTHTGVEIPKFVDKTTPEYKPKFDALVRIPTLHKKKVLILRIPVIVQLVEEKMKY